MRLNEFKEDEEPDEKSPASVPSKKELEDATLAMHKAYLVVDTLLRNMPDTK